MDVKDKLKTNDDKTEFLVIGSRQQSLKIDHCSVRVGMINIKLVKVARNLSAWFDSLFLCRPIFLSLVVWHFSGYIISRE